MKLPDPGHVPLLNHFLSNLLAGGVAFQLLTMSAAGEPMLTPPPRHLSWTAGVLDFSAGCAIVAESPAERQVARAGVLAWTEPGFDLNRIPFDHWLEAISRYPLRDLPELERTW